MICIDFQGGAHGNYLEFVCNKIVGITTGTPFNSLGAAHNKHYIGKKIFHADHFSYWPIPFLTDKIISIQITVDDLLPLQQVSLLRAGNYNYDNNQLEIDTYNKLNIIDYRPVLDTLINGFFKNQIQNSYNAVLREFFQIGFDKPENNGFIVRQNQIKYSDFMQIYVFPFQCFYNKFDFLQEIKKVAEWAGIQYTCQQEIEHLHDKFLQKQIYKDSKLKCDKIIRRIQKNAIVQIPSLDLLEEAYINAKLGKNYFI